MMSFSTTAHCRFLCHVPVVYVDYPGHQSLLQIYGTFNRAMLRLIPSLRNFADPLTEAMVEFYLKSQVKHEVHLGHEMGCTCLPNALILIVVHPMS